MSFSTEYFFRLPLPQADAYYRQYIESGGTVSAEALAHLVLQCGIAGDIKRLIRLAIDFEDVIPMLFRLFDDNPNAIDSIFPLILDALQNISAWTEHLKISACYMDWLIAHQNFCQILLLFGTIYPNASFYKNQFLLRLFYKKSIDAALSFSEQCNGSDKIQEYIVNISSAISILFSFTDETDFFFESSQRIRRIAQSYQTSVLFPVFRYFLVLFIHLEHENSRGFSSAPLSVKRKYENLKNEFRQFLSFSFTENNLVYEQGLEKKLLQYLPSDPLLRQYTVLSQQLLAMEHNLLSDPLKTIADVETCYHTLIEKCLHTAKTSPDENGRIFPLSLAIVTASLFLSIHAEAALHDIAVCRQDFDHLECSANLTTAEITLMKHAVAAIGNIDFIQGDVPRAVGSLTRFLAITNQETQNFISGFGDNTFRNTIEKENELYANSLSQLFAVLKRHPEYAKDVYENLYPHKNITYLYEHYHEIRKTLMIAQAYVQYKTSLEYLLRTISYECLVLDFFYAPAEAKADRLECHAFLLTKNSQVTYLCLGSAKQVREAVQAYKPQNCGSASYRLAEKFWRSTLSPYLERQDKCRLLVCPEGDLNNLSFGMLPCGNGTVIDKYTLRYLANVEALSDICQRSPIRNGVVIYQPDFGLSQNGKAEPVTPLSFARREGEIIVSAFDRSGIDPVFYLTGKDATADEVKKLIKKEKPGVIHFATHGITDCDTQKVRILLAGANQCRRISPAPASPYYSLNQVSLSESDILDMDLSDTSLIFFSLCNAGVQSDKAAENLSGYIRAAMLAGAKTIVAPIGDVSDFCTFMIASLFYKLYLQRHFPPDLALRMAILEFRKTTPEFEHPKYWAQWVCYSVEED